MFKNFARLYMSFFAFIFIVGVVLWLKIPILAGLGFYGIYFFLGFLNSKNSILRRTTINSLGKNGVVFILIIMVVLILLSILPMRLAPFWNGKIPMHRNQYELLADSIINGHFYIEYDDIDPRLLEMENPYDYETRLEQQIIYHYDHAFYNGHYYMYFGVVPVFFLFIPFKLLFGKTLVTFHATQFFMMFSIVAFFILFYMLAKKYFKEMPLGTYVLVTIAICLTTMGYVVQAPALYCTAIISGIFFMLSSLCFYVYAVLFAKKEWQQIMFSCFGALCGALTFGCRPPVGLANLIALPLAITYAKNYKGKHIIRNFVIITMPYVVIAGLLMTYNYVRFENPFEFGQAYQLTSYDQTIYMNFFERFDLFAIIQGVFNNFLTIGEIKNEFPFFFYGGFYVTYPLMWLIVIYFSKESIHKALKRDKNTFLLWLLLLEPIIVTAFDVYWAPGLTERYRLDSYFVVGILVFMLIGYRLLTTENVKRTVNLVTVFSVLSILMAVLMFFYPLDANFAAAFPDKADEIASLLTFGLR